MEVTVQAVTLAEARRKLSHTPFMDWTFWCDTSRRPGMDKYRLEFKVISKEGLLQNAKWVSHQARILSLFRGDNVTTPSAIQQQVMADVLASLGWNAGKKNPTKSHSVTAWWLGGVTEGSDEEEHVTRGGVERRVGVTQVDVTGVTVGVVKVLDHLNAKFRGKQGIKDLLKILRVKSKNKVVTCPRDTGCDKHRIIVHGWRPVRFRCNLDTCRYNMFEGEGMLWFAELVTKGHVTYGAVGMSQEGVTTTVSLTNSQANIFRHKYRLQQREIQLKSIKEVSQQV